MYSTNAPLASPGPQNKQWQIKYVPLSITKSFQVEFEEWKGALNSAGGLSIDDINFSELKCPHATLQINHFQEVLKWLWLHKL